MSGNVTTNWTPALDAVLCDLISEDRLSFAEIAQQMGLGSRHVISSRWRRLLVQMGYQANWPTPAGPGEHRYKGDVVTPPAGRDRPSPAAA